MSNNVIITYQNDGETERDTIEDPDYVDVLVNIGEAAIDGETYTNVTEVEYR